MASVDEEYFRGYEGMEIHEEMLADSVRMKCYEAAIKELASGKVVIDVGAGTGAFSIMAGEADAAKVLAVERSDIAEEAKRRVASKGLGDRVEVHQMLAEDFAKNGTIADLIVSEWMGYMLIYERMLPSVLAVRDSCLKPGGLIIPSSARLLAAPIGVTSPSTSNNPIDWKSKLGCSEICVECDASWVIGEATAVLEVDLIEDDFTGNCFAHEYETCISHAATMIGLALWFEAKLSPQVVLSTSPFAKQTHWKQTILYLPVALDVVPGQTLKMRVSACPQGQNHRALIVIVYAASDEHSYQIEHVYSLD